MASKQSCKRRSSGLPILIVAALFLSGCLRHELSSGLSEREAQEMIVVLKENGLEASREMKSVERSAATWAVYVRGGDQNLIRAWRVLQENGLPRERDKGLDQVFANPGMIPTESEERARLLVGLSGELGRTLRSLSGVADARVHVVLPDNSPLLEKSQWVPPSASVLIKYRTSQPPIAEDSVKNLVAKGVQGLKAEEISVVMQKVKRTEDPANWQTWYPGNQEFLIAALALLVLCAISALSLLARVKHLQFQLKRAREEAAAAASPAAGFITGA